MAQSRESQKAMFAKFRPTDGVIKNPKFKRVKRITTQKELDEETRKSHKRFIELAEKSRVEKIREQKRIKEENRPRDEFGNVIGLAQLTEKFIMEGESEDDAFISAKQELGIR